MKSTILKFSLLAIFSLPLSLLAKPGGDGSGGGDRYYESLQAADAYIREYRRQNIGDVVAVSQWYAKNPKTESLPFFSNAIDRAKKEMKAYFTEQSQTSGFNFNQVSSETEEIQICNKTEVVNFDEEKIDESKSTSVRYSGGELVNIGSSAGASSESFDRAARFSVGASGVSLGSASGRSSSSSYSGSHYLKENYFHYSSDSKWTFSSYRVKRAVMCTEILNLLRLKVVMGQNIDSLPPTVRELLVHQHIKEQSRLMNRQISEFQSFLDQIIAYPFLGESDFRALFGLEFGQSTRLVTWVKNSLQSVRQTMAYVAFIKSRFPDYSSNPEFSTLESSLGAVRENLAGLERGELWVSLVNGNPFEPNFKPMLLFSKNLLQEIVYGVALQREVRNFSTVNSILKDRVLYNAALARIAYNTFISLPSYHSKVGECHKSKEGDPCIQIPDGEYARSLFRQAATDPTNFRYSKKVETHSVEGMERALSLERPDTIVVWESDFKYFYSPGCIYIAMGPKRSHLPRYWYVGGFEELCPVNVQSVQSK